MSGPNPPLGKAETLPSQDKYYAALEKLKPKLHDGILAMLKAHLAAPGYSLTSRQLAQAAGYPTPHSANLHYGTLGRLLRKELQYDGPGQQSYSLAYFTKPENSEWCWNLHPQVVQALTKLRWFAASPYEAVTSLPEEVEPSHYSEGAAIQVYINAFERNPKARAACLDYHGRACAACGLQMFSSYGSVANGFIHVHHLVPLSKIVQVHQVDPITDLCPICPNCHSVIHLRTPPFSIEELREMIQKAQSQAG